MFRLPPPRLVLRLLALCVLLPVCAPLYAQDPTDWPQWRGADGSGVSLERDLPTDLGPSAGALKWKVAVKGAGHSSPIVSNGKVFLTTAYQGEMGSQIHTVKAVGVSALLAISVLLAIVSLRRRRDASEGESAAGIRRVVLGIDRLAVGLAGLGFVGLAAVATYMPDLLWADGQPGETWLYCATISLLGGVAAFGWCRPHSTLRLLGVVALAAGATYLAWLIPENKYRGTYRLQIRALMISPAVAGACWFCLVFFVTRGGSSRRTSWAAVLGGLSLIAAAALLFLTYNFWKPKAGLVRAALCYDFETGKELWDAPLFVAPEERKYPSNSFATPTACADGNRVFTYFGSGYACLDTDGNVLWQHEDEEYLPASRYGASTSPINYGDRILIFQDSESGLRDSFLMSLDRETGDVGWRVTRANAYDSYSTPILVTRGDRRELVTITSRRLASYDPENGEHLWSIGLPVKQFVPGLCDAGNDLLLVAGGTHAGFSTQAVRLNGTGKDTKPEVVWQTRRAVPAVSSPVLHGGCFFTITDMGIMTCFEPETGKVHWKKRLGGAHWSSLVAGDDKVYAVSEEGKVTVVAAQPEFKILSESELDETCFASPAIAHGCVLIRTAEHLYCFQQSGR